MNRFHSIIRQCLAVSLLIAHACVPVMAATTTAEASSTQGKVQLLLTQEEQDYIRDAGQLTAVYNANERPITCCTEGDGIFDGVASDVFGEISRLTGLQFHFVSETDEMAMYGRLKSGEAVLACGVLGDAAWAKAQALHLSKPYLTVPLAMIYQKAGRGMEILAMPQGQYITRYMQDDESVALVKPYKGYPECYAALKNGEASATVATVYLAGEYLEDMADNTMGMLVLPNLSVDIGIGVAETADTRLLSIINKALDCITEEQMGGFLMRNACMAFREDGLPWQSGTSVVAFLTMMGIFTAFLVLLLGLLGTKSRYARRLNTMLNQDSLTGTRSFRSFCQEATHCITAAQHPEYVLLYMDIAQFKTINDVYGYTIGDRLLKGICETLDREMGQGETFARIHSDRFAILLQYVSEAQLLQRLEEIGKKLEAMCAERRLSMHLAYRLGAYRVLRTDTDIQTALNRANYANEQCDAAHGNFYVLYDEALQAKIQAEQELENDCQQALLDGDFQVYYQPKVDSRSGQVIGAEALVRWKHRQCGLLSPGTFLPLFERNGFITEVDMFVFEQVCRQQAAWKKQGRALFPVSCNFSRLHFFRTGFVSRLQEMTDLYEVDRALLEIEITETAAAKDMEGVRRFLTQLSESGFPIVMDDFGSGYSALGELPDLPFDVVKLDSSFIQNAIHSAQGKRILAGTVNIVRALEKKLICEGVETEGQMRLLQEIGCYYIQGYYYGRPMPLKKFEAFLCDRDNPQKSQLSDNGEKQYAG